MDIVGTETEFEASEGLISDFARKSPKLRFTMEMWIFHTKSTFFADQRVGCIFEF